MPIKIVADGSLYTAEVTPPHGDWHSSNPMRSDELGRRLMAVGCDPSEIIRALKKAGVKMHSGWYQEFVDKTTPRLQAAFAGELEMPPQSPFTEAWLTYALYEVESAPSLLDFFEAADGLNHSVPNPDEVAWTFLRLKERGWLSIEGCGYSLTADGRRAIKSIIGEAWGQAGIDRLEEWMQAHPPEQ